MQNVILSGDLRIVKTHVSIDLGIKPCLEVYKLFFLFFCYYIFINNTHKTKKIDFSIFKI